MPILVTGTIKLLLEMAGCRQISRMCSRQQGFTLIEILVVVLIIGIVIGVALVAPSASGPGQKLKDESFRLQTLIEQARERALMEDRELGLSLTGANGYTWWQWSREEEKWQELQEQSYRTRKLPDGLLLADLSEAQSTKSKSRVQDEASQRPTWIFYSDTQVTPFRLEFTLLSDNRRSVILESDGIGPVTTP